MTSDDHSLVRPRVGALAAGAVLVLLVGANVLNNIVAPAAYVLTSVAVAGLLVLLARRHGLTWADLGLSRATARRGLAWAAVLAGGVAVVYALAVLIPATRGLFEDRRIAGLTFGEVLYMALVRVPLGTVLLEEIAFRGVIYGWLSRRWNSLGAVVVSSVLFGLWHILPARGLTSVNATLRDRAADLSVSAHTLAVVGVAAAVAGAAVAGVLLCELRRRSRSLLAPAALHLSTNTFGVVVAAAVVGIG